MRIVEVESMEASSMQHDLLDRAFVNRLRAGGPMAAPSVSAPAADDAALVDVPVATPAVPIATGIVDRLIAAAAPQWSAVADAVERAIAGRDRSRGDLERAGFVLAVVSRRAKDGCTTFAEGLARTLRDRGTDAVTTRFDQIDRDREAVQIVDAGSWFGSGPIRRERAVTLADACDAAILLRRADRSTAAAFARALEVAGVRVLGEVTTFGREPATLLEATT
jgi:hypothetical protein